MTSSIDPVIIVGAGIGGLFAALCLHQRGIDCVVFEKAAELAEVGAGIQIGANGARLLKQLGLEKELEKYATTPARGLMMDGRTGQQICSYPLNAYAQKHYALPHYQIRRADLQNVLYQELQRRAPDSLHLNAELKDIVQDENAVEAVFTDGTKVQGRALVGCDGIHSRTREIIYAAEQPSFANCVAWRALVSASKVDFIDSQIPRIWVGKDRHLVQYPVDSGRSINLVGCISSSKEEQERWQGNSDLNEFSHAFSEWCPQIQQLISIAENPLKWGLYERPVLDSWTSGRVTLLGDAAHAMLPSMAQGAVMAMEDAAQLALSLSQSDLLNVSSALHNYQSKRIARTRQTQLIARKNMKFFHQASLFDKFSAKALGVMGSRAEHIIGRRYDWLYGYQDFDSVA